MRSILVWSCWEFVFRGILNWVVIPQNTTIYRLWRRWFLLYGPVGGRVVNFLLGPVEVVVPRSPFLLNWYFCISGTSWSDIWFMMRSSLWVSNAFNLASIALIVNSLLSLLEFDVPAANAGISTFVFGLSISSYFKVNQKHLLAYSNLGR